MESLTSHSEPSFLQSWVISSSPVNKSYHCKDMLLITLSVSIKRPRLADVVMFISTSPCTLPGWHIPNLKENCDKYSSTLQGYLAIIFAPAPSPSPTTLVILRWSSTVTRPSPSSPMLGNTKSGWRSSAPGSCPGTATCTNKALAIKGAIDNLF